jgi:hypothetical protein
LINAKSHVYATFDFTHIFNCNNIDAEWSIHATIRLQKYSCVDDRIFKISFY